MENEKTIYPIGGFAPGNYHCTCCICKETFQGDKRAVQCEKCAVPMEILTLRDRNKEMEFLILAYRKHISGIFLNHFDEHFKISSNREGKI